MVSTQLRRRGIDDPGVLAALARVPRERFVPSIQIPFACDDRALGIGHGQTISQPYMVALMTQALGVEPDHRVLEIGTGSGYQTAVLAALDAQVYSIERVPELAERARAILADLHIANVQIRAGDGSLGWPEEAPFDRILVTAGAPSVPRPLLDQLDPDNGRLVAPIGPREMQNLVVVERHGTEWVTEKLLECRFVPLLGREAWASDAE